MMPGMLLDLCENPNLGEAVMATFNVRAPARQLVAAKLWRDGIPRWCAVAACGREGFTVASISPIEESGDGPALLIHGGEWGLRLAELPAEADAPAWDLSDASQWAEPFLICRPDLDWR